MGRIVFMRGREWWLSKTRKDGREVYPDRILVGKLDRERVYLPCRFKMNDAQMAEAIRALGGAEPGLARAMAEGLLLGLARGVGYAEAADAFERLARADL